MRLPQLSRSNALQPMPSALQTPFPHNWTRPLLPNPSHFPSRLRNTLAHDCEQQMSLAEHASYSDNRSCNAEELLVQTQWIFDDVCVTRSSGGSSA